MSLLQGIGDETKCCKRHGISVKRLFSFASGLHTLVTVILGLPRIKEKEKGFEKLVVTFLGVTSA